MNDKAWRTVMVGDYDSLSLLNRANVLLVFYDIPVEKSEEKKKAKMFHKGLLRLGYVFVQKSIYAKVVHNREKISSEINDINEISPERGSVNVLRLSLEEFKKMKVIIGNGFDMALFADEVIEV